MKSMQGRSLQALRAAQAWVADHADRIPRIAESGAYRRLSELVTAAGSRASAQAAADLAARSATRTFWSLRGALLRDHLAPIIRIAAVETADVAELGALSMPPRWASAERLHGYAVGIASTAERFANRFVAAGLSADFADRTRAAADAMRDAVLERRRLITARVGARAGLSHTLSEGRRVVRVLDAMVRSALREDAVLFEAWHKAQRVERGVSARRSLVLPALRDVAPTVPVQDTPAIVDRWWVMRMRLRQLVEEWVWRGARLSRLVVGSEDSGYSGEGAGGPVVRALSHGESEVGRLPGR